MKKYIKVIIVISYMLLSVCMLLTINVQAEEADVEVSIETDANKVQEGDTITAILKLTKNTELSGLTVRFTYDTDILMLVSVESIDDVLPSATIYPDKDNINDNGNIGYAFAMAGKYSGTGNLMKAVFKIRQGAALENTKLVCSYSDASDFNGNALMITVKEATVKIMCGHKKTKIEEISASCTVSGSKVTKCMVCGATVGKEETAALGHDIQQTVIKAPTPTMEGKLKIQCKRCDEYEINYKLSKIDIAEMTKLIKCENDTITNAKLIANEPYELKVKPYRFEGDKIYYYVPQSYKLLGVGGKFEKKGTIPNVKDMTIADYEYIAELKADIAGKNELEIVYQLYLLSANGDFVVPEGETMYTYKTFITIEDKKTDDKVISTTPKTGDLQKVIVTVFVVVCGIFACGVAVSVLKNKNFLK